MFLTGLAYVALGIWFLWDDAKERGAREERRRCGYAREAADRAFDRGRVYEREHASAEGAATPRAAGDA